MPKGVYERTAWHKSRIQYNGFKKGHEVPEEWRESWRLQFTGKKMSLEQVEKQRNRMMGNTYNLGKKRPNNSGNKHWNWKNGFIKDGYKCFRAEGKVFKDHQVNWMSANSFWYIPNGFVVHHVDCNKLNNNLDNLVLLPSEVHSKVHWEIEKMNGINRFKTEVI